LLKKATSLFGNRHGSNSHLIEENLKHEGFFLLQSETPFNSLKGLNAIVVADAVSREIVAAKNGSPLIIASETASCL